MSQQAVADAMVEAGFTWRQTTVAKTEAAERPVPVAELVALARLFETPIPELLGIADLDDVAEGAALRALTRAKGRLEEIRRNRETAEAAESEAAEAYRKAQQRYEDLRPAGEEE